MQALRRRGVSIAHEEHVCIWNPFSADTIRYLPYRAVDSETKVVVARVCQVCRMVKLGGSLQWRCVEGSVHRRRPPLTIFTDADTIRCNVWSKGSLSIVAYLLAASASKTRGKNLLNSVSVRYATFSRMQASTEPVNRVPLYSMTWFQGKIVI